METNFLIPKLSEIKVSYRTKVKFKDMIKIASSKDAEKIFHMIWNQDTIELREEFCVLLLSRANRCKGWFKVSEGGTVGTIADIKLIFGVALKCAATSIILGHNHPSGLKDPSEADKTLTRRLFEAGRILEIPVVDHIIITKEVGEFYSTLPPTPASDGGAGPGRARPGGL